ncbi:MAG: hypothetical protein KC713_09405, partial [Candidatus Omnitrophica bacterium]|nr:hypothetical protein [Candidatus Omnitrophota bacterium]
MKNIWKNLTLKNKLALVLFFMTSIVFSLYGALQFHRINNIVYNQEDKLNEILVNNVKYRMEQRLFLAENTLSVIAQNV